MSHNKLMALGLFAWKLLFVQSQIIYSDSFNACSVDLNEAEMVCTVDGEDILWTIIRPKQNRVAIEDNTLVVRNKVNQAATLVSTVIPVGSVDKVLLELQVVSKPGSDASAPLAVEKCEVFFDDVLQVGQREDNTDSFVFPEYTPLSDTVKLTVSNDKDESAGSCEFDELIFRAAGDLPAEVNGTGQLNDPDDIVPIVAPIIAVFAFLVGVAAIFMVYKQRKMMQDHDCVDPESVSTSQPKLMSEKERRGGVRIRRNLEEDVIEKPKSQKQEVQRHHLNATNQEGLNTIRRLQLRKAQSSEETEEDSEDTQETSPKKARESVPRLGPTVSYLKRIQNEAHKSIFRPSSKYLKGAANQSRSIPPKPPKRPPTRSSGIKPTEAIDNDIEV